MTQTVDLHSTSQNLLAYLGALVKLHPALVADLDDQEYDRLTEASEQPWLAMTGEERELANGLSADLYQLTGDEVRLEMTVEDARIYQAIQKIDWLLALSLARRSRDGYPESQSAFVRGRVWGYLGFSEVAKRFHLHSVECFDKELEMGVLDPRVHSYPFEYIDADTGLPKGTAYRWVKEELLRVESTESGEKVFDGLSMVLLIIAQKMVKWRASVDAITDVVRMASNEARSLPEQSKDHVYLLLEPERQVSKIAVGPVNAVLEVGAPGEERYIIDLTFAASKISDPQTCKRPALRIIYCESRPVAVEARLRRWLSSDLLHDPAVSVGASIPA